MDICLILVKRSLGIDLVSLTPAGVESSLDFRSNRGDRLIDKQNAQFAHPGEFGPTLRRRDSSCDICTNIRPTSVELGCGACLVFLAFTRVKSSIAARRILRPPPNGRSASV